jgi:hypothetical protein
MKGPVISVESARSRYREARSLLKEKLSQECIRHLRIHFAYEFLLLIDHIENTTLYPYHDAKQLNQWEVSIIFNNGAVLEVITTRDTIKEKRWEQNMVVAGVEEYLTPRMIRTMADYTNIESI